MERRRKLRSLACLALALLAIAASACMPPSWGAAALLHPLRRPITARPRGDFSAFQFTGSGGVTLRGWRFPTKGAVARGTIVYLHGVADNKQSAVGIAERYTARGYDVLAFDSRAHGESGGDVCTYGFYEKHDLGRALEFAAARPIVVMGHSLGASVALQAAADDPRISGVVAIAPFSSIRDVARERAPFFASKTDIDAAFRLAEAQAHFRADEVSPAGAARRIRVPVLLIHGARDAETSPTHSQRIYAALPGPKRLILVADGTHNRPMTDGTWRDVDRWIDEHVGR